MFACLRLDLFQIGKRKSGLLYLISKDNVAKNEKFNMELKKKAKANNEPHFMQIKPKLVKNSKYIKMMDDICLSITELFDEWLHEKRAQFKNTENNNDITISLNITDFCINDLKYKQKQICNEEMMSFKLDLLSNKVSLLQNNKERKSIFGIDKISLKTRWFIIDLTFCYGIILMVLALFSLLNAPIYICKICIIPMLLCPNYIYKRNPEYGNFSTYGLIWGWYAIRFWDIFNNSQYFRDKSYIFCWFHAAVLKDMFNVSLLKQTIFNIEALSIFIFNCLFTTIIHPYIFNKLLLSNTYGQINNICFTSIYPNIILKMAEILSFTYSILCWIDSGGLFCLNALGYQSKYDMVMPWKSYSLKQFWGKRWNQSVANVSKKMIYKPLIKITNNRYLSLFAVFITLGIMHILPMYLDGFHFNVLLIVFIWFLSQVICLFIEEKIIINLKLSSNDINFFIHSLITFALLFGSFFVSLFSCCYIIRTINN